jgi:tubulin polyglutamylase TTLL6/13
LLLTTLLFLTHSLFLSQGLDWDGAWSKIQVLIVKSLCSVQPLLRNNYRSVLPPDNDGFSCFELLG